VDGKEEKKKKGGRLLTLCIRERKKRRVKETTLKKIERTEGEGGVRIAGGGKARLTGRRERKKRKTPFADKEKKEISISISRESAAKRGKKSRAFSKNRGEGRVAIS